jgi:DNA mismatch repair protein MutL
LYGDPSKLSACDDPSDSAEAAPGFISTEKNFSSLTYLGQAKGLFLLLESDDDLVIIDQHAAHERITYERLREQLTQGRIAAQQLLLPHAVDLGPADAERIVGLKEELGRLGLEVTRSGPDRITVHGIPAELSEASPDRLLADMTLAIEQGREGSRGELEDKVLATMACHGSLRSGRTINRAEAEALLNQMDKVDFAGHCPHGRPVLARIPWHEIRRRVGRN